MSCCDEDQKPVEKPAGPPNIDQIMAGLPQVVLAATDARSPLASSIRNSMPLSGGSLYALPKIHDDGSIEYTPVAAPPPPDITGYTRDPDNPWLFRPTWAECQLRMAGVRRDANGAINLKVVCNNPAVTDLFMRFVSPDDCAACPHRVPPQQKDPA